MKKVGITSAKVHIEFDYYLKGSVMKGTVENGVTEVRSHFEVESDEQDESVIDIIKLQSRVVLRKAWSKQPSLFKAPSGSMERKSGSTTDHT